MKSRFIQTLLPFCVLLILVAISLFSSADADGMGWIPLVGGFADTEMLDVPYISVPLSLVSIVVILSGLYLVLLKTNAIPLGRCILLFLLFVATNRNFLHFNQIYPLLACVVWMQYCLLGGQIFGAYALLSAASLFYAPAIWLVPAMMVFLPFSGIPDQLRIFVKSVSGAVLPHLYLLVFRWIKFGDAAQYLSYFAHSATDPNPPFHQLGMPQYFMLLLLLYVLFRAISFIMAKNPMGTLAYLLKLEVVLLVLSFVLAILFGGDNGNALLVLFFMPASVILSYYFRNCGKTGRTDIELAMLPIAALLCGVSCFV